MSSEQSLAKINSIINDVNSKFANNAVAAEKFRKSVLNSLRGTLLQEKIEHSFTPSDGEYENSLIDINNFNTDEVKNVISSKEFDNYIKYLNQSLEAIIKGEKNGFMYLLENFNHGDFIEAKQLAIGESSNAKVIELLKDPGDLTISQIKARVSLYNELNSSGLDNDLNDWTSTGEEGRTRKQLENIQKSILSKDFNPDSIIDCKFEGWESDGGADYQFFSEEITQAEFISRLLRDSSTVAQAFSTGISLQNKQLEEINAKDDIEEADEETRKKLEGANRLRTFLQHFETWAQQEEGVEFGDKLIEIHKSLNSVNFITKEEERSKTLDQITNLMVDETDIRDKADWSWEAGYADGVTAASIMYSDLALAKVLRAMNKTEEASKTLYKAMQNPEAEGVDQSAIKEVTQNMTESLSKQTEKPNAIRKLESILEGLKNPDGSLTPEYISIVENYDTVLADMTIQLTTHKAFSDYFDKDGTNPSDLGEMGKIYSDMTGLGGSWWNLSDDNLSSTQSAAIMAASMLIPPGGGMAVIKGIGALAKIATSPILINMARAMYVPTKLATKASFLGKTSAAIGNVAKFVPGKIVWGAKGLWKPTAAFTAKYGQKIANGYSKLYNKYPVMTEKLIAPLVDKGLFANTAHFTAMESFLNYTVAGNGFDLDRFVNNFGNNLEMFAAFGVAGKFAPKFAKLAKSSPKMAEVFRYTGEVSMDVTAVATLMVIEKFIDNEEWTDEDWKALGESGLMSALFRIAPHAKAKYDARANRKANRIKIKNESKNLKKIQENNSTEPAKELNEKINERGVKEKSEKLQENIKKSDGLIKEFKNQHRQNSAEINRLEGEINSKMSQKNDASIHQKVNLNSEINGLRSKVVELKNKNINLENKINQHYKIIDKAENQIKSKINQTSREVSEAKIPEGVKISSEGVRTSTGVASEKVLIENSKLSESARIEKAEDLLGRKLKKGEQESLLKAHEYTQGHNVAKGKALMEGGFTRAEAKILMDQGVAGKFNDFFNKIFNKSSEISDVQRTKNYQKRVSKSKKYFDKQKSKNLSNIESKKAKIEKKIKKELGSETFDKIEKEGFKNKEELNEIYRLEIKDLKNGDKLTNKKGETVDIVSMEEKAEELFGSVISRKARIKDINGNVKTVEFYNSETGIRLYSAESSQGLVKFVTKNGKQIGGSKAKELEVEIDKKYKKLRDVRRLELQIESLNQSYEKVKNEKFREPFKEPSEMTYKEINDHVLNEVAIYENGKRLNVTEYGEELARRKKVRSNEVSDSQVKVKNDQSVGGKSPEVAKSEPKSTQKPEAKISNEKEKLRQEIEAKRQDFSELNKDIDAINKSRFDQVKANEKINLKQQKAEALSKKSELEAKLKNSKESKFDPNAEIPEKTLENFEKSINSPEGVNIGGKNYRLEYEYISSRNKARNNHKYTMYVDGKMVGSGTYKTKSIGENSAGKRIKESYYEARSEYAKKDFLNKEINEKQLLNEQIKSQEKIIDQAGLNIKEIDASRKEFEASKQKDLEALKEKTERVNYELGSMEYNYNQLVGKSTVRPESKPKPASEPAKKAEKPKQKEFDKAEGLENEGKSKKEQVKEKIKDLKPKSKKWLKVAASIAALLTMGSLGSSSVSDAIDSGDDESDSNPNEDLNLTPEQVMGMVEDLSPAQIDQVDAVLNEELADEMPEVVGDETEGGNGNQQTTSPAGGSSGSITDNDVGHSKPVKNLSDTGIKPAGIDVSTVGGGLVENTDKVVLNVTYNSPTTAGPDESLMTKKEYTKAIRKQRKDYRAKKRELRKNIGTGPGYREDKNKAKKEKQKNIAELRQKRKEAPRNIN